MTLIDISQSVSPATAVWPGDQQVEWTWTARLGEADASVNLGSIQLSTHTGTHVDAPFHIDDHGATTDDLPLDAFVGPVQVVEVEESASSIRPSHVDQLCEDAAERVLFKTFPGASPSGNWPDAVVPIDPDTIRFLSGGGTVLVGTDAPSVDPLDSTDLPAHHALMNTGIVNLEGLALADVPPGQYRLIALPLKIAEGDAAPVRAVLRRPTAQ
ncbi:cyclase family protein [Salinibacter altiplanensis]|uniref:cyclase family protein n=1 Tax=Salinibacter altiplanensis TaxID=1803181 RepID=UPI000C9FBCAD|nr:cyclase family protein [Salinibacter altiplanensis]